MHNSQEGWTALMLACEQDNIEVVKILLEHNAGIEVQTLVAIVTMMYMQNLISIIIIIICTQDGWTAVMIACVNGHLDIVHVLVEKQANVNHRTKV